MRMSTLVCKTIGKKLKFDEVLCPICREIYIEPISLPCKHVVCLQCLQRTVEVNRQVCPICRTRIATYLRLGKNLKKIVDQPFWQKLKSQFPVEIRKKLNGEEDGICNKILLSQPVSMVFAERGTIKEEFDNMFQKLKIEEERSRKAEQLASETLAKQIMVEEMEQERQRKICSEEISKSDVLYIKSLMLSENEKQKNYSRCNHNEDRGECSSTSSSNDRDSISDELRHFTPICIAPKTPPKRLPNGKLKDPVIMKPINLMSSSSFSEPNTSAVDVCCGKNKTSFKVLSTNFLRTKAPFINEDVEMTDDNSEPTVISDDDDDHHDNSMMASDLNSNIRDKLPMKIIKDQECIQIRIKQEQEDMAIAIKMQRQWNKEKSNAKKKHGYHLRSAKKKGKKS